MNKSDAQAKDPAMLGNSNYERSPLDHYVTPRTAIDAFLQVYGEDLPSFLAWEPFCGTGAFSNVMKPLCRDMLSTDIVEYDGFPPDALFDFFKIGLIGEEGASATMEDVERVLGFMPDAIITNPPYGKEAAKALRHALKLMEPQAGFVSFLCRADWDSARTRADLFDHPAYLSKIVLRHRPRWIADSDGAPRHNYAYFNFSWVKANTAPNARPEIFYAG